MTCTGSFMSINGIASMTTGQIAVIMLRHGLINSDYLNGCSLMALIFLSRG